MISNDSSIPFTQFMLPNGARQLVHIERPAEIIKKANVLRESGFRFEIEILTNDLVSMEVLKHDAEITLAHKICANGPDVPVKVDELVNEAFEKWSV